MTRDQQFLKALRVQPDEDIGEPDESASTDPDVESCAPCASKDAWIEHVQEANKGMVRRLDWAHRFLFLAAVAITGLALCLLYETSKKLN